MIKKLIRKYVDEKRAKVAKKYVDDNKDKTLLDIGCGDGFFIRQFNNLKTTGVNKIKGHYIETKLSFEDNSFDYVTMLATIEHLEYPKEIIKECFRVLKKKGKLILTIPFEERCNFIHSLYDKIFVENLKDELHLHNFNKKKINEITKGYFNLKQYKLFELGLNQLFIYEK